MDEKKQSSLLHLIQEKVAFDSHAKNQIQSENYLYLYDRSINQRDLFWKEHCHTLSWNKFPEKVLSYCWDNKQLVRHTWFEDGILNVSANCLDRHLGNLQSKIAIIWQGQNEEDSRSITYKELWEEVCRFANLLKSFGVKKGDRVCIYLPMIPELAFAMLACARIGAIHSIIFAGFSADSVANKIEDCQSKFIVTANGFKRGSKSILLKNIVDKSLEKLSFPTQVIVVKHSDDHCLMHAGRDYWYHDTIKNQSKDCSPEPLNAEDPLFILYTSGSTGLPKGVVHTQAGYLLHASLSHKHIFDIKPNDIYWCTADIGWITGHSYVIYGPLANGSTTLMYEGIPTYPDPGRFWRIIEKYKVSVFYTAPTVIRTLISQGDEWVKSYDLSSLRILGTVGEPINPEAWIWYYTQVGHKRCPIEDTWWQTETGGIMIAPVPGSSKLKAGCASRPFFGIEPVILRSDGSECAENEGGCLCIKKPWPGIMRTTWGEHQRFVDTYFSQFPHVYFTGDGCYKDEDGDFWLMGRIDDVVNISGHRLGTAEIESALVSHTAVAEAAVVPIEDPIKGQNLYAFVTLINSIKPDDYLKIELSEHIKIVIGSIAVPKIIHFTAALPKTRSGKIMRRILRKIVENDYDNLGDITTLSDPTVIQKIISEINDSKR